MAAWEGTCRQTWGGPCCLGGAYTAWGCMCHLGVTNIWSVAVASRGPEGGGCPGGGQGLAPGLGLTRLPSGRRPTPETRRGEGGPQHPNPWSPSRWRVSELTGTWRGGSSPMRRVCRAPRPWAGGTRPRAIGKPCCWNTHRPQHGGCERC